MAISKEELLEAISNMTALEISELVKAMEEKFGVSASAPTQIVGAAPAAASQESGEEEKSVFDVFITSVTNKIAVIKVVKTIVGLGLKETKELVEAEGQPVKTGVAKADAEEMKKKIEEAGAVVELR